MEVFSFPRTGIIAQAERKDAFLQQINRRTFRASGLDQVCLFYNYSEVYRWYLTSRYFKFGSGQSLLEHRADYYTGYPEE